MNTHLSKIAACLSILILVTTSSSGKNNKNNDSKERQPQPQRPQPQPQRPQPPRPQPQRPPQPKPKPQPGKDPSGGRDTSATQKKKPVTGSVENGKLPKVTHPPGGTNGPKTTKSPEDGKKTEKVAVTKGGGQLTTTLDSKGRKLGSIETAPDGSKTNISHKRGRDGETRSTEEIKQNPQGRAVSKTVTVKQPSALARKTAFKDKSFVKHYDRGRYGFVYRHGPARRAYVNVFRTNAGIIRPYRYAWHWNPRWYGRGLYYFPVYATYPAPDYWVTDWMVASYLSDAYWTEPTITEAGPDRTMISDELKEDLRVQVVNTIDEEESAAVQPEETTADVKSDQPGGEPVKPITSDLANALKNPKYIYPVSETLSATIDGDETRGVTVSCGDLLKLEPGQGDFDNATENDLVKMRVMTSKGQKGDAKAGDLIRVPLKYLQDFDSEFRSRIDQGLAEAVANKELFVAQAE